MKKLYLVDVSSMFFRAFYAIPPLTSSQGLPTNALYGFLSMAVKLLREVRPDYMAFCFDRKDGSFRYDLYSDYKANRAEMPDALAPQVPYVRKLTQILGIPDFDKQGFEADDVIGSLTRYGRDKGLKVVIVSGDKDFAQLIGPYVSMFDTMKNVHYDEAGAIEKWGVHPRQMIDYLAIVGDASDNIPGIRGIGPKGAVKLLCEFGELEKVFSNVDNIKAKGTQAKIREGMELARLSKQLVTICTDVDFGLTLEDLRLKSIDKNQLKQLLEKLEFTTFLRTLTGEVSEAPESQFTPQKSKEASVPKGVPQTTAQVNVVEEARLPAKLKHVTWSLEQLRSEIEPYCPIYAVAGDRGISFGYKNYLINVEGELRQVGEILGGKFLQWKGFHLKDVWTQLELTESLPPAWDSMLAAYVLKSGSIGSFDEVFKEYVGRSVPELYDQTQLYQCYLTLEAELGKRLQPVNGISVLEKFELPLVPVLYRMERKGIAINVNELKQQSELLTCDIACLEKEIYLLAGEPFNVASPKQLGPILFEKLGLPTGKKTKTGYSTNSDVLERLRLEYPIADKVLQYRELAKLKSTYVDALPQLLSPQTHRLHSRFRQAATSTGRLSSVHPNLQNIPIRTERGRLVRKAFIADEGFQFLSADYSQVELRVLAHITEDPGLLMAFNENIDIHTATASEIFDVAKEDVTPELRRRAKAVNFGIAYGQGVYGLSESLNIDRSEASEIIDRYFSRYRKVQEYMVDIVEQAKTRGYVETVFGRRRYIEELQSKNGNIRKFGERAAINAPIQGTASDLVKSAMIAVDESVACPMLLQVHDELLFECQSEDVEASAIEIKEMMQSTTQLRVPLSVNVAWGPNWEDAHA